MVLVILFQQRRKNKDFYILVLTRILPRFDTSDTDVSCLSAEQRLMAHYILLLALVLENEFVQYIVRHTLNRSLLSYYINHILRDMVAQLTRGTMAPSMYSEYVTTSGRVAVFVRQARTAYVVHCIPKPVDNIGPAF